jgi:nucleoside phosphorylase
MQIFSKLRERLAGTALPRSSEGQVYAAPRGRRGRTRVAVITVIDEEFDEACKVLGTRTALANSPYFVREAPNSGDWDVVVSRCMDRSNIPSGEEVGHVIEDLRPQVLLLVGIAGGMCDNGKPRDDIHVGDVLIAESVAYVDFLKIDGGSMFWRHYAIDHPSLHLRRTISFPIQKTFRISSAVTTLPPSQYESRIHIGQIVSTEKVMGGLNHPVQTELLKPFDKALAVDMESIGVARGICASRTSFWYNPLYSVIRGISDLAGAAANDQQRTEWKVYAAHAAAIVAREFIRRLPSSDGSA